MKSYIFLICSLGFITSYKTQTTLIPTGTTSQLNKISIINNNIVINGRFNYLAKSYNECNNFTALTVAGSAGNSNYLQRVDSNMLYLLSLGTGDSKIFKSVDGGNTWVQKYDTNIMITHFCFFDSLEGITISPTYKLKRTKNGGNTWSSGSSPAPVATAVEVFGDSMICLGSGDKFVYISKDRGKTWPNVFYGGAYLRDIYFINKDSVFVVSAPSTSGISYFTKTYNGGSTWQNSTVPLDNPYAVYFKTSNEGYILGHDNLDNYGTILKTANGGQSWLKYKAPFQTIFIDINFINDSIALLAGTNGILLRWNVKQTQFVSLKENNNDDIGVKVYPNPVNDVINIDVNILKGNSSKLQLLNSLGQIVTEEQIKNVKSQIDLSHFPSGVYTLKVFIETNYKTIKIIKN
jgi:hypothetical protein